MSVEPALLSNAFDECRKKLIEALDEHSHWTGQLSSSALSTAVAVFALGCIDRDRHRKFVEDGLAWLVRSRNDDGGWGDTPDSPSNLSTTLLCYCAFSLDEGSFPDVSDGVEDWVRARVGTLDPSNVARAVLDDYGKDRTFSTPILMMCAIAGRFGDGGWDLVPQLPFELACAPQRLFRMLRLHVVSYAIPALISMGIVRHHHSPSLCPVKRWIRNRVRRAALAMLERIQPASGGFLEATPLTSFVTMSLVSAGHGDHPTVMRCRDWLVAAVRDDGSWPIDIDLATWVSALAVNSLDAGDGLVSLEDSQRLALRTWFLSQQRGGWAWTDLPGGVIDGDDTATVLLALKKLGPVDDDLILAAAAGITWLLDQQNRDGGFPTFDRGWGRLLFDRSCPDITAHAIEAMHEWRDCLEGPLQSLSDGATRRALGYLSAQQKPDGSWMPLWFGNQYVDGQGNPVYGTAQVVTAMADVEDESLQAMLEKGRRYVESVQNPDGGWGGAKGAPSSIEETGLAVGCLAGHGREETLDAGVKWLVDCMSSGHPVSASPIGLYFARLWYSEAIYPLVFAASGLGRVLNVDKSNAAAHPSGQRRDLRG